MPTSKPILELLERDAAGARRDRRRRRLARAGAAARRRSSTPTPRRRARALDGAARRRTSGAPAWTRDWIATRSAPPTGRWTRWLAALDEPFEGAPFAGLAAALPDGAVLWAGNSMPVRDLDAWLPSTERAITVRSNRGANGIDGVVSTALGSAAVPGGPSCSSSATSRSSTTSTRCVRGAAPRPVALTIVLVNNDGGGIFSFLPQARPARPAGVRAARALRGAVRDAARRRRRADRRARWAASTCGA